MAAGDGALLVHRWLASELADLMDFGDLDRVASGLASKQVSLRGTLLAFGGTPAPEHDRKASVGCPVFHLAGRHPVDIEAGSPESSILIWRRSGLL